MLIGAKGVQEKRLEETMADELYNSKDYCSLAENYEALKRENIELATDKIHLIQAAMDGGDKYHYTAHDIGYRDMQNKCKALEADLTAERERNRWIPVGERLPDNPDYLFIEPVLICHGDDEIVSAVYYKGDLLADDIGFYINELMDKKLNDVTYWRPIVAPEVE